MTPRTAFLLENPGLIIATGVRFGVPSREMEDFTQEVLMKSLKQRDRFNPRTATITTYATRFVEWCARRYLLEKCEKRLVINSELVEMILDKEQAKDGQNGENSIEN